MRNWYFFFFTQQIFSRIRPFIIHCHITIQNNGDLIVAMSLVILDDIRKIDKNSVEITLNTERIDIFIKDNENDRIKGSFNFFLFNLIVGSDTLDWFVQFFFFFFFSASVRMTTCNRQTGDILSPIIKCTFTSLLRPRVRLFFFFSLHVPSSRLFW